MASITIDPSTNCIGIVCGIGETDVSITAAAIYKAWKDWFVLSDNSKYLPAFDSAGGDPVGASNLDNVYFLQTLNGWSICPVTTELEVVIRISGNLFPDAVGAALFDYTYVAATGHTHMETTVSTSARQIETGVSGLTASEASQLAKLDSIIVEAGRVLADVRRMNANDVVGTGLDGDPWRGVGVSP